MFFRFPHTPHLVWLGKDAPRDDKVLPRNMAAEFLGHEITAEEKVDGANIGFSVDGSGVLRAQNRGSYLVATHLHPQFHRLPGWLAERKERLVNALGSNLILFGEWCVAVHTLRYTRLPDWFLGFDVYDSTINGFWSAVRRDTLLSDLDIRAVPRLGRGHFDIDRLCRLAERSRLGDGPAEGVVVRRDAAGRLVQRAKLVRAEFLQGIGAHWTRGPVKYNSLQVVNGGSESG